MIFQHGDEIEQWNDGVEVADQRNRQEEGIVDW